MIIYEVNLSINNSIISEYRHFLVGHINRMLQIAGFQSAKMAEEENSTDKTHTHVTVWYEVTSRQELENYFTQNAARMRAEAIELFGDQFSASRRVFELMNQSKPI